MAKNDQMQFITPSICLKNGWLIKNYINAIGGFLQHFKGEKLQDDYIKLYKLKTCIAMQKKNFDDLFFIQEVYFRWSFSNQLVFINLNEHGSHVALKLIEHPKKFNLDMITLPSHIISHDLQSLIYVSNVQNLFI